MKKHNETAQATAHRHEPDVGRRHFLEVAGISVAEMGTASWAGAAPPQSAQKPPD